VDVHDQDSVHQLHQEVDEVASDAVDCATDPRFCLDQCFWGPWARQADQTGQNEVSFHIRPLVQVVVRLETLDDSVPSGFRSDRSSGLPHRQHWAASRMKSHLDDHVAASLEYQVEYADCIL
jgi:hypothetical protein